MDYTEKIKIAKKIIFAMFPLEAIFLTECQIKKTTIPFTAYTNGIDIYLNFDLLENKYEFGVKDYVFVILHEITHIALSHCNLNMPFECRTNKYLSHLFNIAADSIINYIHDSHPLFNNGIYDSLLMKYGKSHKMKFVCPFDETINKSNDNEFTGILYDNSKQKTNYGINEIYDQLKQNKPPHPLNHGLEGDIQYSNSTEDENGIPLSTEDRERLENLKELAYNYAVEKEKELKERGVEVGNTFSEITRKFGKVNNNWCKILKKYMFEYSNRIKSERRFNRRAISRGFYWKGMEKQPAIELCIAIDTSASVSDQELNKFASSINHITKHMNVEKTTVIYCDVDIQKVETNDGGKPLVLTKFYGRGGTNFEPVYEYINESNLNPKLLVYFTDMGCHAPRTKRRYNTIWASTVCPTQYNFKEFKVKQDKIIFVDVKYDNW